MLPLPCGVSPLLLYFSVVQKKTIGVLVNFFIIYFRPQADAIFVCA